jgi:hypothetical protein
MNPFTKALATIASFFLLIAAIGFGIRAVMDIADKTIMAFDLILVIALCAVSAYTSRLRNQ